MSIKQSKWSNYILLLVILFSALFLRDYKVGGLSAFLILPLGFITVLLVARISQIKISLQWIKKKGKKEYVILGVYFWVILRLLIGVFSTHMAATVNLNFIIITILSCSLYFVFHGSKGYGENWLEAITISGGVGIIVILLSILKVPYINIFLMIEEWYRESLASYVMLPIYSSSVLYCTSEKKSKRILSFIIVLLSFFALFLINNQTSLWLVFFFLLGIPMLCRPRASLVKKSMQLTFDYLFLWCNMCLIIDHIDPSLAYNLEVEIYGELMLFIGALFFFYFWNKIPEEKDLNTVNMLGLQRFLQKYFLGFLLFLIGCILNVNNIRFLSRNGYDQFIGVLMQPLVEELQNKRTSFLILYQNTGIVITILVIVILLNIGKSIYGKVHKDKIWTNYLFLFYLLFMVQFLLLNIADQVVIVDVMLLLWGLTIEENPLEVKSIKEDTYKKEIANITVRCKNIEVKEETSFVNKKIEKEKKSFFKKDIKEESRL